MKVVLKHISFIVLLLLATPVFAQSDSLVHNETSAYEEENIKQHEFDEAKWKNLKKELNYNIQKKKEEKKKTTPSNAPDLNFNPAIVKMIFWIVIGLVVVFLIILFVRHRYSSPKNHKITNTKEKSIISDYIPENIEELNLRGLLDEYSKAASYREAIRIYYLIVLRDLNAKNLIVLKKNSISREFLQSLHGHKFYRQFFELTRLFEKVWYGDFDIEASNFPAATAMFEEFINAVDSSNK